MRFIVADNRETVCLAAPFATKADGVVTVQGKFRPKARILELTDAQVALFETALTELCKPGKGRVLYAPAGWPPTPAPEPEKPAEE